DDVHEEVMQDKEVTDESGKKYTVSVGTGEKKLVKPAGDLWQFRDQELDRFIMRGLAQRLTNIEVKIQNQV
ncbi:TPA: hypothetical protein ACQ7ZT_002955, partial [Escherichia coli]